MGKFDRELEQAKKEIIEARIENWKEEWRKKWYKEHKKEKEAFALEPPNPPDCEVDTKAWFIAQWDTGYCIVDMQELMKKPKKQRDKILALGGLA